MDTPPRSAPGGAPAARAAPRPAAEQLLEPEVGAAPAGPGPRAEVAEDRAEKIGEPAAVAEVAPVLDAQSARRAGRALGVALPVGAERVVPPALLGAGQELA